MFVFLPASSVITRGVVAWTCRIHFLPIIKTHQESQNTMKTLISYSLLSAALGLLLCGCASATVKISRVNPAPAPAEKNSVRIYKLGDKVSRPYEILGVVSAVGQRPSANSGKARDIMTREAAAMGAEALIWFYYDENNVAPSGGPECWSQALAVKFLPEGTPPRAPSRGVAAIPQIIIGEEAGSAKKAAKTAEIVRKFARLALAQKGYYALLIEEQIPQEFPNNLKRQDQAGRNAFGSSDADAVLPITLGKVTGWNALFASGATSSLDAALFSKSANQVTWTSTARGANTSAHIGTGPVEGVAHLFVPSAKTIPAVASGLQLTFESLPDISTATFK